MKKALERLLKTNPFFNKMYTLFGSAAVKFLGLFVRQEKGLILFVSFMGTTFSDSPKEIFEFIIKHEDVKNFKFVWAFQDESKFDMSVYPNVTTVKMDSLEYLLTALKAEYWITNVNIERGLHFKKAYTKYLNTWHGIPLKKVGNDVQGRSDFKFSTVNIFTYSGEYEKDIYLNAFRVNPENLFKFGMPRNDALIHIDENKIKELKERYGLKDKKIILYAPTWREIDLPLRNLDVDKWKELLEDEYYLLVKYHHISDKNSDLENNDFCIDVTDYQDTNILLSATDVLVTDYSSIMFDYSLLSRPIMLYAYDYEQYASTRGVYFDLKAAGLPLFEDEEKLIHAIKDLDFMKEKDSSKEFCNRFYDVRDGNSTQKMTETLFGKNYVEIERMRNYD